MAEKKDEVQDVDFPIIDPFLYKQDEKVSQRDLFPKSINNRALGNDISFSTFIADLHINKDNPTIYFSPTTVGDTNFWVAVRNDLGGDDDDTYQIGKGAISGTTPLLALDTNGNFMVGETSGGTNPSGTNGRIEVLNSDHTINLTGTAGYNFQWYDSTNGIISATLRNTQTALGASTIELLMRQGAGGGSLVSIFKSVQGVGAATITTISGVGNRTLIGGTSSNMGTNSGVEIALPLYIFNQDVVLSTVTGTKIGTATTQKLAFYNSTPIVQPLATTDLGVVLSNLGLRAVGTAYPITTSGATALGQTVITSTSTPQLKVAYDGSNHLQVAVASNGAVTFTSTGAGAGFTFSPTLSSGSPSLHVDITAVGNVGVGEDNLITYAMPGNTLSTNGDYIDIEAWGTASNTDGVTGIKLYFGSTILSSYILQGAAGPFTWIFKAKVIRTAAATQDATSIIHADVGAASGLANGFPTFTTPTETLSGAVTIKCTGEGTNNDDYVQEGLTVRKYPNA